jgi:hypothetical protein
MKKKIANVALSAIAGAAFGFALLAHEMTASATTGYHQTTAMRASLMSGREKCSAWCGDTLFTGTSWNFNKTALAQMTGSRLSGGGTAHVRAHAGCKLSNTDITIKKSAWSSGNEAVSTSCESNRNLMAWDCEIEVNDACN